MSDKIKWGESYESIAKNISPYLQNSNTPTQTYSISTYPIWWDSSITLYNRYENPITNMVTWYKTYISNCCIQSAKTMISGGQTVYNTDNNIIRIPQNDKFIEYADWINIPNDKQSEYFTLHQGDIIIKGTIDFDINEYEDGKRSTDLIDRYKQLGTCLTIDNWQNNTGNGRIAPHYFVSGE